MTLEQEDAQQDGQDVAEEMLGEGAVGRGDGHGSGELVMQFVNVFIESGGVEEPVDVKESD